MEQNLFRKANSSSANQEILRNVSNCYVDYSVHNNPPFVSYLSQIKLAHILPSCFSKFNISFILRSMPKSYKWSLSKPKKKIYIYVNILNNFCSRKLQV
jgi:hypothetical protein